MTLSIICSSANGLAASYADDDGHVVHRICLNADMIWPLLVPEFTASEKASYRVTVAKTLLHEVYVC